MNNQKISSEITAALQLTAMIGEAIKKLGQVPSGHLYARLMNHMSLETYNKVIDILKKINLVEENGMHLLTWIGSKE